MYETWSGPAVRRVTSGGHLRWDDRAGITASQVGEVVRDGPAAVAVHADGVEPDARLAELDAGEWDPWDPIQGHFAYSCGQSSQDGPALP